MQALAHVLLGVEGDAMVNPAIPEKHHAVRIDGGTRVVGNNKDRLVQLVARAAQELHDGDTGSGIQVARRFIGQDDSGLGDQCACDCHPLLLATDS